MKPGLSYAGSSIPEVMKKLRWNAFILRNTAGQMQYPFRPLWKIRQDQNRNVSRMIGYAYKHVPYYRETMKRMNLDPSDFTCAEDIEKLPLLTKQDIQKDPEYYVSKELPVDAYLQHLTGGSTGIKLVFYEDPASSFLRNAHSERARGIVSNIVGKRTGYRVTSIALHESAALQVERFTRDSSWVPRAMRMKRQALSILDPPEKNIELINRFRPDAIATYGSYVAMMFAYVEKTGVYFHVPRVILYGADFLPAQTRNLISHKYGVSVLSRYQAIEAPRMGFECDHHRGIHLNLDLYPVRIVDSDGRSLPDGERGEVVVSNLVNRGSVVLNYMLDDVASIRSEKCTCGRSLPLMDMHLGRMDDIVRLPNGSSIHPITVQYLVAWEDVLQYQVIQETLTHFKVNLVVRPAADTNEIEKSLKIKFEKEFGREISISVRFVEEIERTESGKYRVVISRI